MREEYIEVKTIRDNETWNSCYGCGYYWKDKIPTPGLVHRTLLCDNCKLGSLTKKRIK